jgi:hypothetical protein
MKKLKDLLNESVKIGKVYSNPYATAFVKENEEEPKAEMELTNEQKAAFFEAVKQFKKYGESVYRNAGLSEVYESIKNMVEVAGKVTISETGDWFDGVTVGRHMKRMGESFKVFEKTLKEVDTLQQRLESSYDEIGEVLGKYYEISELNETDDEIEEGNEFGAARAKAIANGDDSFEVDGKKYPVKDVDKDDKDNAEEFVDEAELSLKANPKLYKKVEDKLKGQKYNSDAEYHLTLLKSMNPKKLSKSDIDTLNDFDDLYESVNEGKFDRDVERLYDAKEFDRFIKKHKSKFDKKDYKELLDYAKSFNYEEKDFESEDFDDPFDEQNAEMQLDTSREDLKDLILKTLKESVNEESSMKLTNILKENKYSIIDPKGNTAGTGTKDQANRRAKTLGGSKKGYFVVPAKKALVARRTLEKHKFDFKNAKLQNKMSDLYFESVVNEAKYDIGMARKGNGLTVYNKAEEEKGDYKNVAHIDNKGKIKYYDKKLPSNIKKEIEAEAKKMMEVKTEGTMKLKNLLKESIGIGELPSSKLMKMKVSAKDMLESVGEDDVNEARVSAKKLLQSVVKGETDRVEGIKISKEMAQSFLDWQRLSPFGKKYGTLPFNRLFTAAFSFGLNRYADKKSKEYKELEAKANQMFKARRGESVVTEGASTEEKRIVMLAVRKIAKYRNVPIDQSVVDVQRAAEELERDIQKGKVKK